MVFEPDIMFDVFRAGTGELAQILEEPGQAFVELDLTSAFPEQLVVQALHGAVLDA